mgnify:FL=1
MSTTHTAPVPTVPTTPAPVSRTNRRDGAAPASSAALRGACGARAAAPTADSAAPDAAAAAQTLPTAVAGATASAQWASPAPAVPTIAPAPTVPLGRLALAALARGGAILLAGAALAASGSLIWISPATVLIDVLTLAMLALLMRREGRSLADLYRPFLLRDIGWGLLAFIGTVVVWFVASFIGNLIAYHGAPPMGAMSARLPMWAGLLCFAVMPLTIALAEEGLYRGYLQPRIGVRFGAGMALVVPALAFSLQHLGFALSSPEAAVAKLVTTLIAGLFFGALMMAWKRTVPTVIAHWMLDLLFLGLPILMMTL